MGLKHRPRLLPAQALVLEQRQLLRVSGPVARPADGVRERLRTLRLQKLHRARETLLPLTRAPAAPPSTAVRPRRSGSCRLPHNRSALLHSRSIAHILPAELRSVQRAVRLTHNHMEAAKVGDTGGHSDRNDRWE